MDRILHCQQLFIVVRRICDIYNGQFDPPCCYESCMVFATFPYDIPKITS